jgi:hypothetical protein
MPPRALATTCCRRRRAGWWCPRASPTARPSSANAGSAPGCRADASSPVTPSQQGPCEALLTASAPCLRGARATALRPAVKHSVAQMPAIPRAVQGIRHEAPRPHPCRESSRRQHGPTPFRACRLGRTRRPGNPELATGAGHQQHDQAALPLHHFRSALGQQVACARQHRLARPWGGRQAIGRPTPLGLLRPSGARCRTVPAFLRLRILPVRPLGVSATTAKPW